MAKRAQMTVDDVVQQCADSDDDYAECDYDPDEPVMEGSDDEFSDLEGDNLMRTSTKATLTTCTLQQLPAAQVPPALLGIRSQHGAPPSNG